MNFLAQTGIQFEQFDLLELFTRMSVALLLSAGAGLLSYWSLGRRTMNESLLFGGITLSLIITMILLVLSANIFYALGLFAALSIIRFRTPVKDVRDTVHLFLCIGVGIACGAGALKIAVFCTLFILSIQQIYQFFVSQRKTVLIAKIILPESLKIEIFEIFFKSQCSSDELIKVSKTSSSTSEYYYHLTLKKNVDLKTLAHEVGKLESAAQVELLPCRNEDFS